ncbi:glycoside hydrolase family 2 protein [Butyrivibrio sp. VCD2006]|uniref:glycoside hydrolase family 2 protein n=1 Tax=Butyrivibrio sp. VCD2006 TaxID=1280664 RepID=UPI0003F6C16F|nr:glycoside hydrolase family 2 TIM barrel-domain containing protein [Butyrivibrio sp. VCD2006]
MDLIDAIKAIDKSHEDDVLHRLTTIWGEALDKNNVLKEYPRPQFARESYINLNGTWEYAFSKSDVHPKKMDGEILVPFSPESILSGVERQLKPDEYLWYRKKLENIVLPTENSRVLLHFGAIDQKAIVFVNGTPTGAHCGGYLPFTVDITDALTPCDSEDGEGTADAPRKYKGTLTVCVQDDSDTSFHSRGKQTLKRGGMYYTAQSGIWQTVWMEIVPDIHITSYRIIPDRDLDMIYVTIHTNGVCPVSLKIYDSEGQILVAENEGETVHRSDKTRDRFEPEDYYGSISHSSDELSTYSPDIEGKGASTHVYLCKITMPKPHLWTPEDPYLYKVQITAGDDVAWSYFGMRSFTRQLDAEGHPLFFLNGEPYFLNGVLDQGYWPDGLYTAPSDEALIFDITEMKEMGFNMLRKHIKIEAARWYYHCDRLGMIVWQDMVSGGSSYAKPVVSYLPTLFPGVFGHMPDGPINYHMFSRDSSEGRREWTEEMEETIQHLINVPSISVWVLFNEGWGQFNASAATIQARQFADNRLIDQASGWFDENGGDFRSVHNYFRPLDVIPDKKHRAFVISEYGGYTCYIEGHSSVDRVYGYKKFDTVADFKKAYNLLMKETIEGLKKKGLAGAVYTQLSDVEEEVNGIMTYDRRHNKLKM